MRAIRQRSTHLASEHQIRHEGDQIRHVGFADTVTNMVASLKAKGPNPLKGVGAI